MNQKVCYFFIKTCHSVLLQVSSFQPPPTYPSSRRPVLIPSYILVSHVVSSLQALQSKFYEPGLQRLLTFQVPNLGPNLIVTYYTMLDCTVNYKHRYTVNIPFGISSIVSYSQPYVAMWNLSLGYSYLRNGFFSHCQGH